MDDKAIDLIVVGAGLAGLTAARRAHDAGLNVRVLEARDRVGGKIWNAPLPDGTEIEAGGQYIGPRQTLVYQLAEDLGLQVCAAHPFQGDEMAEVEGAAIRIPRSDGGWTAGLSPTEQEDLNQLVKKFESLVATLDLAAPWLTPGAVELDQMTLQQWLLDNGATDAARTFVGFAVSGNYSCDAWDISLLHSLIMLASEGGDLMHMMAYEGGPQQDRIVGGSQLLARGLAELLGTRVQLSTPVRSITQARDTVTVAFDDGMMVGRHVIVAVPPALAARIRYEPDVSVGRDLFTQRVSNGHIIKIAAVYHTPFWRADGLSGTYYPQSAPGGVVFDNSPPWSELGVAGMFIVGGQAAAFSSLPPATRQKSVIAHLIQAFGSAAAQPIAFYEHDWAVERWSRGGHNIVAGPGTWTKFGPHIRQPEGRIHWAGSETSLHWLGYMEGAVSSGLRAADEVIADGQDSAH